LAKDEFTTRRATTEDAIALAETLSDAVCAEMWASDHARPLDGILNALAVSQASRAVLFRGEVVAVYGAKPFDDSVATVWMIPGKACAEHPHAFMRWCKAELPKVLARWPLLFNFVDIRFGQALRWAEFLGFAIEPPKPYGKDGRLFCCITLMKKEGDAPCVSQPPSLPVSPQQSPQPEPSPKA
jgi:hypothetical protein